MQTTEKEKKKEKRKKEKMVDIDLQSEKIIEIVDNFIAELCLNKDFCVEASVEVYKTEFSINKCLLEIKLTRKKQSEKDS